jgi:hypothetical protein
VRRLRLEAITEANNLSREPRFFLWAHVDSLDRLRRSRSCISLILASGNDPPHASPGRVKKSRFGVIGVWFPPHCLSAHSIHFHIYIYLSPENKHYSYAFFNLQKSTPELVELASCGEKWRLVGSRGNSFTNGSFSSIRSLSTRTFAFCASKFFNCLSQSLHELACTPPNL